MRSRAWRNVEPSAAIADTQSIRTGSHGYPKGLMVFDSEFFKHRIYLIFKHALLDLRNRIYVTALQQAMCELHLLKSA